VTQTRELALAGRVVAFAAGSLTLPPGELDQPALIKPRRGAVMHHGGSLMGSRGPLVRRFEPKHKPTFTPRRSTATGAQKGGWTP
jgi:hypothetical protein